jgi:DmsE family decaheme c-type cytochrome
MLVIFITPLTSAEDCLDCHEEMAQSLVGTTHENPGVACASCHHGDKHVDDPSTDNITVPTRETAMEQLATCTACHKPHLEMDQVGFDPHQTQGFGCVSCHKIHEAGSRLLIDQSGEFCGKCHTGVTRQFERRTAHPLEEDVLACWSCHDFIGAEPNMGKGSTETCLDCHSELAGPFRFEHQALSSFSTEGSGCVACHSPHGSGNERMLKQPGDGLCRQCHGVPARHANAHNGAFAGMGCVECHSDIHGSYDDKDFLDPMLGVKLGEGPDGCFCHTGSGN